MRVGTALGPDRELPVFCRQVGRAGRLLRRALSSEFLIVSARTSVPPMRHSPDTGETVLSCTMIVTDANAFTRAVHNRMPVLLGRPGLEAWLRDGVLRDLVRDRTRGGP